MSNLTNKYSINNYDSNELSLNPYRKKRSHFIIKRLIDILGSIIGLVVFSLLFIVIALLIKIENPKGKIFFSQNRVGKDGKQFKMYKFRSMVADAELKLNELLKYNEVEGAMFKIKDDPRVTKVGKFIRKTSIDELPQLFNVLKGDMSLVGPRPPLPREVDEYNDYQKQRLLVKPGCTGIWQSSARNSVGFDEMVEMDLFYIRESSLFLDIKIIIKTILVLFGSKNAY
ncbi:multidrug MFS transporter [Bacillus sp. 7586-K]|nr:multidrug MFS transporter [Bacillus sp. 7586-K]